MAGLSSFDGGTFNAMSSLEKRGDQFRLLYEQLKEEYATLNDAYTDCQRTLEKSTEDNRQMQEKFKNLLDKLQLDNRKKQSQIEEMKTQVSFSLPLSFQWSLLL